MQRSCEISGVYWIFRGTLLNPTSAFAQSKELLEQKTRELIFTMLAPIIRGAPLRPEHKIRVSSCCRTCTVLATWRVDA
jgi:hypothetical protein